jgi:hypothetical protein
MYGAAVLTVAALITTPVAATQDRPTPAQANDPKAAEAASIEGKWHLTMPRMGGLAALSVLDLKLTGKKITGTLQSVQMGEIPVKGEFSNNKLKFSIEINMGAQTLFADFEGKLKDGELNGTLTVGPMGEVEWKGTRPEK